MNKPNLQKALELLPWYANGSLSETETRFVESVLADSEELQQALTQTRQLANHVELPPLNIPDSDIGFAQLKQQIQNQPQQPGETIINRFFQWLIQPQGLALACSFAVAAIAVSIFIQQPEPVPGEYSTYSSPVVSEPAGGPQLRVVFAPGISDDKLHQMVSSALGRVVGGPNPVGAYTIEFTTPGQQQHALKSWRKQTSFRLVEPVGTDQ